MYKNMFVYVIILCLSVISSAFVLEKRTKPNLTFYEFINNISGTNERTLKKTGIGILSGTVFSIFETIIFYTKVVNNGKKIISVQNLVSGSQANIQWGILYFVLSSFLFTVIQSIFNEKNISIWSQAFGLGIGFAIAMIFIIVYHRQNILVKIN